MSPPPAVLIVGAGPTGLFLAIWLHRFDVPFRIIDKATGAGQESRAIVIHARTLEFYEQLGIAEKTTSLGRYIDGLTVSYNGVTRPGMNFRTAGHGQTQYPIALSLAQNEQHAVLEQELKSCGGAVEWGVEMTELKQYDEYVEVALRSVDGSKPDENLQISFVAGCDGGHSQVRQLGGFSMEGGTYRQRCFVADVRARSPTLDAGSNVNVFLSRNDFTAAISMKGDHCARFVGFTPDHLDDSETVTYEDCEPSIRRNIGPECQIDSVDWFSHYRVHHLAASQFRKKRVFILGDAAHLHTPVGGQGMNTGLGDATNLAWKLACVYHDNSKQTPELLDILLDTYDTERSAFAHLLVQTTDYMFQILTGKTWMGYFMRNWFMPYLIPPLWRSSNLSPVFYERMSQLGITYRMSKLSEMIGRTKGKVQAGDRLPWIEKVRLHGSKQEIDNYRMLKQMCWQGHVYGESTRWVRELFDERRVPFHVFEWTQEMSSKGFGKDELYLVRPDGHVGLVVAERGDASRTKLEDYMGRWFVRG